MSKLRPAIAAISIALFIAAAISVLLVMPRNAVAETPAEINSRIEAISEKEHDLALRIRKLQGKQDVAQADLERKAARERELQAQLDDAKAKLARLKKRLAYAQKILSERLVTVYKQGEPDIVTVVLESKGFREMVERATYLRRIAEQDQHTINKVTQLKKTTKTQSVKLAGLEQRQERLVAEVTDERDVIATKKGRVLASQGDLKAELARQRRLLRAASAAVGFQPAPNTVNFRPVPGPNGARVTLNSDGSASAPASAPAAIKAAVAAGNQIRSTPYIWGGGHGSFSDRGYDCSGSVSYVLHAAGVLSSPMASGGFMSWAASGPGKWITIYTNPGHMWMTVGGLRFDTSGRSGTGSRWQNGFNGAGTAPFTIRHYPGL
ncbi:MAG: coiled-coil domain-containing protein [Solirubrobacterales bacterium]